jgi:protein-S-isoprenylcysteine O-methyltransferase Ste14
VEDKMVKTDAVNRQDRSRASGAGDDGEHPLGHLIQLSCLAAFLAVWTLDSFLLHLTTFGASLVPLAVRLGAAGLILSLALYFSLKGHVVLQDVPGSGDGPTRDGAFARVRHPIYLGTLLVYVSLSLSTLSLLGLAAVGGCLPFYDLIASYEEGRLVLKYGDAYRDYERKVPRWIPRLRPARFDPAGLA